MKYFKIFDHTSSYTEYMASQNAVSPNISYCYMDNETYITKKAHDYSKDYFTIESLEDNNEVKILRAKNIVSIPDFHVEISTDNGGTWAELVISNDGEYDVATINKGEKILFNYISGGLKRSDANSGGGSTRFITTGTFNVYGNLSKLNGNTGADSCGAPRLFYEGKVVSAENLIIPIAGEYSHKSMFQGCTSLVKAPKLLAENLKLHCYNLMFAGCTSLTKAPELPSPVMAERCYANMFSGCTSLETAPELPAMVLATECYDSMFRECTSLTEMPVLSATTLAVGCYEYMFFHCTSLTTIPSRFSATTLANSCYQGMFSACTSLTAATELPAATVPSSGYAYMFKDCTSLTVAPSVLSATTVGQNGYRSMFLGCTSLTVAPEICATTVGNESLIYMFQNCTKLVTPPSVLPATTIGSSTYRSMFSNCASLISSPEICATTIGLSACTNMFEKCSKLVTPPSSLSATTLTNYCYYYMFYGCSSLTATPIIHASTLAADCCASMFSGCTSLTVASELSGTTTGATNFCYTSMFAGCTALTAVTSVLPSTSLGDSTYRSMFYNCKSLTVAPEIYATSLAFNCCAQMFSGCTSLTTAPSILPATTLASRCYEGMFWNCTSLTTAPILPAKTLLVKSYQDMFNSCRSLNYIKMLAEDMSASDCSYNWVSNVSPSGIFVKSKKNTTIKTGSSGIPNGWIINEFSLDSMYINAVTNASVSFTNALEYTDDDGDNWYTLAANTPLSINSGDTVYLKGEITPSSNGIGTFSMTGSTTVGGNPTSLILDGDVSDSLSGYDYAFKNLFSGCTSLTDASQLVLPTTLSTNCYEGMFDGCTNLAYYPQLSATTLSVGCYKNMFKDCTNMSIMPSLPATTLTTSCYEGMFKGCTNITLAQTLSAETLVTDCYKEMFSGCSSLERIECMATPNTAYTTNWVNGVASSGVFIKTDGTTWDIGVNGIPTNWQVGTFPVTQYRWVKASSAETWVCDFETHTKYFEEYQQVSNDGGLTWDDVVPAQTRQSEDVIEYDSADCGEAHYGYFTLRSLADNNTFTIKNNNTSKTKNLSYSLDGGETWSGFTLTNNQNKTIATINSGDTIMMKGNNTAFGIAWDRGCYFRGSQNYEIEGNIASLLNDNDSDVELPTGTTFSFAQMFSGDTHLINAENLRILSTTLYESSFNGFFRGCTNLQKAPDLSVPTTLGAETYSSMFEGCTSLYQPPSVLSATTAQLSSYKRMFCMNRNSKVTTQMTKSPIMIGNFGSENNFNDCQVFCGNGSLTEVKCYWTNNSGSFSGDGLVNWMNNVSSSGTFYKRTSQGFLNGVSGIPNGWTIINDDVTGA